MAGGDASAIERVFRAEYGRAVSVLVRVFGGIDIAEEAVQEAFAVAAARWPSAGLPPSPAGWIITTARNRAIDRLRREASRDDRHAQAQLLHAREEPAGEAAVSDDRLRLIFTCCHPALPPEGQIALTLREVCGLTTEEIAHAFLVTPATLAQRIVRAKAVVRDKAIPYQVPTAADLPARLNAVLLVVYLIFNQGYSSEANGAELSREAIRLGRLLLHLLPEPEVLGLLGLMLLQESRRAARTSPDRELILLEEQDRSLWNQQQIAEGIALTERALQSRRFGAYTLQAAIAAVHAESSSAASTDWRQIMLLYDRLLQVHPSPVVELNRAVAVAMVKGPEHGLSLIEDLFQRGQLSHYHLAHSSHADLCRRLRRIPEARASYEKALALLEPGNDQQEPERRFLVSRLREVQ